MFAAFLLGAATAFVMVVLSLRFYVDMKYPTLVFIASFVVAETMMNTLAEKKDARSRLSGIAHVIGRTVMFALGGSAALLGLNVMYPLNH